MARRADGIGARFPSDAVDRAIRSGGIPFDAGVRTFMEGRFGHTFENVRIHANGLAAESADAVQSLAYTVGSDIVFARGQYEPATERGRDLIAHELTHVVQQTGPDPRTASSLRVSAPEDPAEHEAETVARRITSGSEQITPIARTAAGLYRKVAPHIKKVTVDLTSQSARLDWSGSSPAEPGTDSFTVSTGKGYSNPEDKRGTCTRTCCSDPETQCASPFDRPESNGACCTPVGNFWTGTPQESHNGWSWWTPVEPIHTSGHRGIALHQHTEVTGQAIGHGCIRMEEANAHRIFKFSRGRATTVTITGHARVDCPTSRRCGASGSAGAAAGSEVLAGELTQPDTEPSGPGGSAPALATIAKGNS